MTATLSNGVTDIEAELRLGWESANESQNIEHSHLDGSVGVTLRPDLPRTGTLRLLFPTAAAAEAARQALTAPDVWTFTDDLPELSMTLVRRGSLAAIQQDGRRRFVLEIGFREVVPT